jgi:H+/gluconate symporter-like permease
MNLMNVLGNNYNQSIESDILLLDISNNDEYVWTDNFTPPSTSSTQANNLYNKSIIIVVVMGSSIGGFSLAVICFILYKWNKNKQKRKEVIPASGNEEGNRYNHENLVMSKTRAPTRQNFRIRVIPK